MKNATRCALVLAFAAALSMPALSATSSNLAITLPPDKRDFKPGPGRDVARANCLTCHSAAYVYMQPPLTKAQWTGEANKMKAVYGAPIAAGDIGPIVDYLMTQNGKE